VYVHVSSLIVVSVLVLVGCYSRGAICWISWQRVAWNSSGPTAGNCCSWPRTVRRIRRGGRLSVSHLISFQRY